MSAATQYYMITILVYVCANVIAAWGLDLQFGVTGVLNFAFIIFQAIGAYTAACSASGRRARAAASSSTSAERSSRFRCRSSARCSRAPRSPPIVGLITLRRLRSDYQAMVMLVVSVVATIVVTAETGLVNGAAGLSLIAEPDAAGSRASAGRRSRGSSSRSASA